MSYPEEASAAAGKIKEILDDLAQYEGTDQNLKDIDAMLSTCYQICEDVEENAGGS